MNVLIATEDAVFCRMLTLEFSEKGFSVLCAGTKEEAEALLEEKMDRWMYLEDLKARIDQQ